MYERSSGQVAVQFSTQEEFEAAKLLMNQNCPALPVEKLEQVKAVFPMIFRDGNITDLEHYSEKLNILTVN